MSEASRARRQRAINLREEAVWREQQAPHVEACPGADLNPSWGPVGSRLKAESVLEYEHVLRLHEDILRTIGTDAPPAAQDEAQPALPPPTVQPVPPPRPAEKGLPGTPEHVV